MNLLRSFCCLFAGRCAEEEPKPTTERMRREAPSDLGQKEGAREKRVKTNLDTWRAAQQTLVRRGGTEIGVP
jgi:hypothetical protein